MENEFKFDKQIMFQKFPVIVYKKNLGTYKFYKMLFERDGNWRIDIKENIRHICSLQNKILRRILLKIRTL